ncbi:MAG: CDP-diacylglycerol--serine O-phosphatidyltransferase [Bacteriovoracaceae bacterium]|jgi:hypothetical protein
MIKTGLELFIPLVLSNTLHMFVVKKDWFSILKIPIHSSIFGENKTYRGFVFVGIMTGGLQVILNFLFYQTFSKESLVLGFSLGITYMLFELPNSFLKRMMKIAPGHKSNKHKLLFTILDKSDSTFGVCLVFVYIKELSVWYFLFFFICAFTVHLAVSKILFNLKIKESL